MIADVGQNSFLIEDEQDNEVFHGENRLTSFPSFYQNTASRNQCGANLLYTSKADPASDF